MKNHIFLFQVHKQPGLLDRILSHLEAPNHYFAVNIDKKSNDIIKFKQILSKHKNIIYVTTMNITHGGFSIVLCTLKQIEYVISSNIHFDYYHTLSGQDYPCVSSKEFDAFFENNTRSYMMFDTKEQYQEWKTTKYLPRLEHYYLTDNLNNPFFRKIHLPKIINSLVYWIPRKYTNPEIIWGGWNWFSLHDDVIRYLLAYINNHPEYLKRFKYTFCSDEMFFNTILHPLIEEYNIEPQNSLRYIDWYPKRPYTSLPLLLNEKDYKDIVASGSFFCRKVDENSSKILLKKLDEKINEQEIKERKSMYE